MIGTDANEAKIGNEKEVIRHHQLKHQEEVHEEEKVAKVDQDHRHSVLVSDFTFLHLIFHFIFHFYHSVLRTYVLFHQDFIV